MSQPHEIRQYEGVVPPIVLVGVPSFGQVSIQWHSHMMQLQTPLNRCLRHLYIQGKEVGDARNEIVEHALAFTDPVRGSTVSHILFIDDDVLVPSHAIMQLLSHDRPIVSGLYYAKTVTPQPLVLSHKYTGVKTDLPASGLVECDAHGMGCTLIARQVFETVERPWFQTTKQRGPDQDGVPVFVHQTEDVWFLDKARRAGFQPTVDAGLFCFHWSNAERIGYPIDRWQAKIAADAGTVAIPDPVAEAFEQGMLQIPEEIRALTEWLQAIKPRHVLEIGSHRGGTSLLLSRLATGTVVSVDLPGGPFGGLTDAECQARNQTLRQRCPNFTGLLGDSHRAEMVEQVRAALGDALVDVLFLDGDHRYAGVKQDFALYQSFVKPGGWIVFHDINDTAAHRAAGCFVSTLWQELDGEKIEFNTHAEWAGIGAIRYVGPRVEAVA